MRVDAWLDVACLYKTRSEAKRGCESGKVEVNGDHAKPHRVLREGDRVRINRGYGRYQDVIVRILIDQQLGEHQPPGYAFEPRSHFAVAAAVAQGRADWGITIETVARQSGLRFRPLQPEHYDLAMPSDRWDRPGVRALRRLLDNPEFRAHLEAMGFASP